MSKKEKKTKQTNRTGYVPFTKEDINMEDGRNSRAEELFLQMLDVPKRVIKKKSKGKDIVDDDFYPTSNEEAEKMQGLLGQVEAAIDDRSDAEFMSNVAWAKEMLVWSKSRHYEFAWWIVGCVFVVALYFFYQAGDAADDRRAVEQWSETVTLDYKARAEQIKVDQIASYNEYLSSDTLSKSDRKYYTKQITKSQEKLDDLQKMSWEEYRKAEVKESNGKVWAIRWEALWCLIWIGLYILAVRPYGYMISKRRVESKIYSGLTGALFGIAGALFGAAAGLQVTETVTHWSDGSKTKDDDTLVIFAMKIGLLIAAVVLVLVVARIAIVVATVMGFIRNYDLIGIAKQSLAKGKELTTKQAVK